MNTEDDWKSCRDSVFIYFKIHLLYINVYVNNLNKVTLFVVTMFPPRIIDS